MNFTLDDLRPTEVTAGLVGNSWNSTHLTRTYGLDKPHDLSANAQNMAMLFAGTDRYDDKPYVGMLEGKNKKMALTSRDYTWKMMSHFKQFGTVLEVIETSARPGQNFTEIVTVLDTDQYQYPDVIIFEDENYPLEVQDKPKKHSSGGYLYRLLLQTDDDKLYLPSHLLQVGQTTMKVSSSVTDEMNQDYGTLQFNTIFELRSQMGNSAVKVEFTDKMLRIDKNSGDPVQKLKHWRVPFLDNKGSTYYNFMPMAEAAMWNQLYTDVEWATVYGKVSTRLNKGYLKKTGPGLRQQLDSSNRLYHNGNLSLIRMEEFLSSIYRGRTDASPSQRNVVLDTGEMGALLFDRMAASDASSFTTVDTHFISGTDPRHLAYGAQFTRYIGKNGLDVTIMLNPGKDNSDLSRKTHPLYSNIPLNSWRMDILDLGTTRNYEDEVRDNMQMVCERYADYYYTSSGKWDKKTGMPINDGAEGNSMKGGYGCYSEKSHGLLIRDRSRMAVIDILFDE